MGLTRAAVATRDKTGGRQAQRVCLLFSVFILLFFPSRPFSFWFFSNHFFRRGSTATGGAVRDGTSADGDSNAVHDGGGNGYVFCYFCSLLSFFLLTFLLFRSLFFPAESNNRRDWTGRDDTGPTWAAIATRDEMRGNRHGFCYFFVLCSPLFFFLLFFFSGHLSYREE